MTTVNRILAAMKQREKDKVALLEKGWDFPITGCLCSWVNKDDEDKWRRTSTHLDCPIHPIVKGPAGGEIEGKQ